MGGGFNATHHDVSFRDSGANGIAQWGVFGVNSNIFETFQIRATAICARLAN